MPETLLSSSSIWLFGRIMDDISLAPATWPADATAGEAADTAYRAGGSDLVRNAYKASSNPKLARIYGFSYQGYYYDMAQPTIFMVHLEGVDANGPIPKGSGAAAREHFRRLRRQPSGPDRTGLGTTVGEFPDGMKAWLYDRADFTIRLDMETGSFDRLLLEAEMGGQGQSSGMLARSSGMLAQSSGMLAQSSGMLAQSSGMLARNRRGDGS